MGACVGRGEMLAVAMRPIGVAIGPGHGMAPGMARVQEKNSNMQPRVTITAMTGLQKPVRPPDYAWSAANWRRRTRG